MYCFIQLLLFFLDLLQELSLSFRVFTAINPQVLHLIFFAFFMAMCYYERGHIGTGRNGDWSLLHFVCPHLDSAQSPEASSQLTHV